MEADIIKVLGSIKSSIFITNLFLGFIAGILFATYRK